MKRSITILVVFTLVLALALPAAAIAKKGGVPASDNGKGKVPVATEAPAEVAEEPAPEPSGKEKAKAKAKAKAGDEDGEPDQDRDQDRDGSVESSATPAGKLTGVPNALARLQANLDRMQQELEDGTRTNLPPGLQRAIAKFMLWLGLTPDDGGEDPDDGSVEPTSTVEPTGTVEPTITPEPTP